MNIVCYKNIIFYKHNFYTNKENIKTVSLDDRINKSFTPLDINSINFNKPTKKFDKICLLLDHFHWNPAHMMWDFIYPSWYGLYYNFTSDSSNCNFQWITKTKITDKHIHKYLDLYKKYSNNSIYSFDMLSNNYDEPLCISFLITGLDNIGIGNIYKNTLCANMGLQINNIDPVELFVNRFYKKYNIQRNSLHNKESLKLCNNIVYIINKRPYNGIEKLFEKVNKKYSGKYNFKIIDYKNFTFEEQLKLLNTTCICIVGVGTARFNTPFMPNGAIEIQTFEQYYDNKNNIKYVDYHAGTISKYIKVKNIPFYTKEEVINNKCSGLLEEFINESINELPIKIPINVEDNIPNIIKNLKNHKNYDKQFDVWRNNLSNRIDELMDIL